MKIYIINGPNLNMLGLREPAHYGKEDYASLSLRISKHCEDLGVDYEIFQSNHEGAIVDKIQEAYFNSVDGIVINPGAYTHTSIALRDALAAVSIPAVEIHISDVMKREDFRQISFVRDLCFKTISGHGTDGYLEAIDAVYEYCKK